MFGCIVAGRLIQTNLQQVDVNKYVFELPDAATVNHIVVFLLGTIPFDPGYAATVHFLWPGSESGWKLLGMLSNEKPSAIFRLRGAIIPSNGQNPTFGTRLITGGEIGAFSSDSNVSSITATLGISIEPISVIEAQITNLSPQINATSSENISQISINILKNFYNYVTSFCASTIPFGAQKIGIGNSYISAKVFQDWYDGYMRKVKMDPSIVLKNESDTV
ncbi:10501_t:CDS:2 [Funneliformis caledonium]|uniref:10501_t:CDS:1 n=1 Tax=Funneliformis caledonium TaxID=1117310 RepID=A0A9N9GQY8_9GLOM|nr:10501_t:CDS:2 [Funneliformis caledonium]